MPDISNLNFAELVQLRNSTNERIKEMRETGVTQLRATIAEQAELLGVTLKDLLPKGKKRGRPRKGEVA